MRESRTYGSVRGAPSDGRPYRDQPPPFAGTCFASHDDGARSRFHSGRVRPKAGVELAMTGNQLPCRNRRTKVARQMPIAIEIPATIPRAALVTGAAQRIGRAIALALAEAGFDVAVHCHTSRDAGVATCEAIHRLGRRATLVPADLADEAATQALLPRATAALGPIGVLVNNASPFERDDWHDATRASWDAHIEPGLRAPFVLMQQLRPRAAKGRRGRGDQHAGPAGVVDHAAFRILHRGQGRPLGADAVDGAGARPAHPGERHRPRSGAAQHAPDASSSSPGSPPRCRCIAAPAPTRSPVPCSPSLPCRR